MILCIDYALVGPDLHLVSNVHIIVRGGRIERIVSEVSSYCDYRFHNAVAIPPLCNAHIHGLDVCLLGYGIDKTLDELVSIKGGLKYRLLRTVLSEMNPIECLNAVKSLAMRSGVLALGIVVELGDELYTRIFNIARGGPYVKLLAQPSPEIVSEGADAALGSYLKLLQLYDGVCLDTVYDVDPHGLQVLDEEAKRGNKLIQVHVSETPDLAAKRDYELLKGLSCIAIVHGTFIDFDTYTNLELSRFPWIACPRSNMYHSSALPDPRILINQSRISRLALGSDNASWFSPDVSLEISTAFIYLRKRIPLAHASELCRALLRAATYGCYSTLGIGVLGLHEGARAEFLIVKLPTSVRPENVLSTLCLYMPTLRKYLVVDEEMISLG